MIASAKEYMAFLLVLVGVAHESSLNVQNKYLNVIMHSLFPRKFRIRVHRLFTVHYIHAGGGLSL